MKYRREQCFSQTIDLGPAAGTWVRVVFHQTKLGISQVPVPKQVQIDLPLPVAVRSVKQPDLDERVIAQNLWCIREFRAARLRQLQKRLVQFHRVCEPLQTNVESAAQAAPDWAHRSYLDPQRYYSIVKYLMQSLAKDSIAW